MTNWLKIGVGCALLYLGVLRGAKGLIVKVSNYSFRGVNLADGTVSLDLNFLVKNPLFVGLKLKAITGDVYAQGQKVGSVNTTVDYYLSGGKSHIIPVVVNLQMANVGQAVLLNIQSGDIRTLTIGFDGKLYVGDWSVGIPVQIDLNYDDLRK